MSVLTLISFFVSCSQFPIVIVIDIDSITKNWKYTKLILLLRAHDKWIFVMFVIDR